jgi:hypothetical protein
MSNQCMVEVRHFADDVLVLVEDNYGKTFRSYDPDVFSIKFKTVTDLLRDIADNYDELDGSFYVEPDTDEVVLECASSLEVYGFNGESTELNFNQLRNEDDRI